MRAGKEFETLGTVDGTEKDLGLLADEEVDFFEEREVEEGGEAEESGAAFFRVAARCLTPSMKDS